MHVRRLHVATAAAVFAGAVVVAASPGLASTPPPPRFSGNLPGSVSCTLTAKIRFATPLTLSGTPASATVSGKLRGCSSTNPAVVVKSGRLSGTFTGSPLICTGPAAGAAAGSLSVTWKAEVNGVVRTVTYKGRASAGQTSLHTSGGQLVSNGGGQQGLQILGLTSGSFPSDASLVAYTPDTAAQLTTLCETKSTVPPGRGSGIKSLELAGSATLGPVGSVVSDGSGFCAAESSGLVTCWGSGASGALGNNQTSNQDVPVILGLTTAAGLASDGNHSYCANLVSGAVDCWGLDTDGELGNGVTGTNALVPGAVTGVTTAVSLASDGNHSYCALLTSGAVDCWGLGTSGELGNGVVASSNIPVAVFGLSNAVSLAADGEGSYCAVASDGSVDCWGSGADGDLGNGTTTASSVPVPVTGLSMVSSVVSDGNHSYCALLASGAVECWGLGTSGELGDGATTTSHVPVAVTGITTALALASNGNKSYCAQLAGGAVSCWGLDDVGQLGDGATTSSDVPVAVSGLTDAAAVAGDGANSYCAVLATEAVECWGAGGSGQLGNGAASDSSSPVTAAPMGPAVSLVGDGTGTFCAVLASNGVDCWGSNGSGALGAGMVGSLSTTPVAVSTLIL